VKQIYLEDLKEGDEFWGDVITVDPAEMMDYNLKNDPWPIHVNEEDAKKSPFGGIIASGGFTITLMYRSMLGIYNNKNVRWEFLGGFDWKLKFVGPVRAGDKIRTKLTVVSARLSSKGGRGVLTNLTEMYNQNNETVLSLEAVVLLASRLKEKRQPVR